MFDTGSDEVAQAASTGTFVAANVANDFSFKADPMDVTKAVFQQDASDARLEFEGTLTVIAVEPIVAATLGDLYVDVDISFMAAALSYEIDDPSTTRMKMNFQLAANNNEATPLTVSFRDNGAPPPVGQVNAGFTSNPLTTDVIAWVTCQGYNAAPVGGGLQFSLMNDANLKTANFGQTYVMSFYNQGEGGAVDWTNGTILATMSLAMIDSPADDGAADADLFQCILGDTAAVTSGELQFSVRFIPMDNAV